MRVLRAIRLERSCGCTIGVSGAGRSVPPAGPLTAQTVGFEPARSEPNPSAGIRASGRRALSARRGRERIKHVVLDVRL
jgi:hypothetical protein